MLNSLLSRLQSGDESMDAAIATEVGIPIELQARFRSFDLRLAGTPFDEKGQSLPGDGEYILRFFGVVLDTAPESGPAWNPVISVPDYEDNIIYLVPSHEWIQPYRVLMFSQGSSVIGEMRWNPDDGIMLALVGLETPHTEKQLKHAWRGLRLMKRTITQPGRRVGSTIIQDAEEIASAYEGYKQRFGTHPTQEDLASHMGFSDSTTLKRYLRNNRPKTSWPPRSSRSQEDER